MQKKDWFAPPALLAGGAASLIFFENGSRIVQYLLPNISIMKYFFGSFFVNIVDNMDDIPYAYCLYVCCKLRLGIVPNDEVEVIFPMSLSAIQERMNSNPEDFTGAFINTVQEYCCVKEI